MLFLIIISLVLFFSITTLGSAIYPEKDIRLIIAAKAGGGDDRIIQTFKPFLEKYFGKNIICVYKPGAGMAIAWGYIVNNTKPDGYTLGMSKVPHLQATEIMRQEEKQHEWEDIVPLYNIVIDPNVLIVKGDSEINTLDEYIQYCKDNPQMVTLSTTGVGGDDWIAAKLLQKAAEIDNILVAYQSDPFVIQSLLGGHIKSSILNVGGTLDIIQDGRAKALAVFADERVPFLPDVPTTAELGYNVVGGSSRGFSFLKGTPQEAIDVMVEALDKAANDPEFLKKAEETGLNVVAMSQEEYKIYWNSKLEDIKQIFKEAGL